MGIKNLRRKKKKFRKVFNKKLTHYIFFNPLLNDIKILD